MKKRTGIAIDEDIYDYLKERNINVSGLVNSLLRTYVGGGESDLRVLDRQINEVRDEIDSLRDKLRIKESELRRLSKKKNPLRRKGERRRRLSESTSRGLLEARTSEGTISTSPKCSTRIRLRLGRKFGRKSRVGGKI